MLDLHQIYASVSGRPLVLSLPDETLLVCEALIVLSTHQVDVCVFSYNPPRIQSSSAMRKISALSECSPSQRPFKGSVMIPRRCLA